MTASTLVGIVVDHSGFAPVADQRQALASAGAERVSVLAPMTAEDWHYALQEALAEASGVAVVALQAFGLTAHAVLAELAEVVERDLRLVVVDAGIDTASDPAALRGIAAVIAAVDEGGLIRTRAIIDSIVPGETKSPPKARSVAVEEYERAIAR